MSQLVKDLDLKAFHNWFACPLGYLRMSQLVKDLDLKAFHNQHLDHHQAREDVTARQRS